MKTIVKKLQQEKKNSPKKVNGKKKVLEYRSVCPFGCLGGDSFQKRVRADYKCVVEGECYRNTFATAMQIREG